MCKECIFCKIVRGEIEANIVFENEFIICLLDAEPINEGHILVIPKVHYLDVDELPDEVAVEIMRISQRILLALKQVYKISGYSIMQNGGEFNDVGHYHMHIFPRYKNDGFGWIYGEINKSLCNMDIATKLSNEIQKV